MIILIRKFLGSKEHYNTCNLSESGVQKRDAKKLESLIIHIPRSAEFSFSSKWYDEEKWGALCRLCLISSLATD